MYYPSVYIVEPSEDLAISSFIFFLFFPLEIRCIPIQSQGTLALAVPDRKSRRREFSLSLFPISLAL